MRDTTPVPDATDGEIAVVSNREPYEHVYGEDGIEIVKPSGGLTRALDGVLGRVGGTWVAWGSGEADFDEAVVPETNTYEVRSEAGTYDLRRLPLTRDEVDDYYYGYSNSVLWPLCHLETGHVELEPGFWSAYRRVNRTFAEAVCELEAQNVWFQDYHLALVPSYVRAERGATGALLHFWHVPWPPADVLAICPHARELIEGLLCNDAVGFHVERYRRNFLACVDRFVDDARVLESDRAVAYDGRRVDTYVTPVGVDPDAIAATARSTAGDGFWRDLSARYGLDERSVVLGVDRLDYTKGIVERLDAFERLWEVRPERRGRFVFVQKATETRKRIPAYRRYRARVRERVAELNERFGTDDWTPVAYVEDDLSRAEVLTLYREADVGVVSPRRDGMNLVSMEYCVASESTGGVLLLSEFAGAAEILSPEAIPINPFDTVEFARAIDAALDVDPAERQDRCDRLIERIRDHDLDAWIGSLVERTRSAEAGGRDP
ncbi:MAG: trehalose-6-phosphate synthase [Salinigranum sp.]